MKADLKDISSTDIDERSYWPDDEKSFSFTIDATIGPLGEESGDVFHFHVCTPNWILRNMFNRDFGEYGFFGIHMIIVEKYDFDIIRHILADLCRQTSGTDWEEISQKLSCYGDWEYSNH